MDPDPTTMYSKDQGLKVKNSQKFPKNGLSQFWFPPFIKKYKIVSVIEAP